MPSFLKALVVPAATRFEGTIQQPRLRLAWVKSVCEGLEHPEPLLDDEISQNRFIRNIAHGRSKIHDGDRINTIADFFYYTIHLF
jgi:hypothetical protein